MTATRYPFNRRLKLISSALGLVDTEIARAATLGGIETSRHRASSWNRAEDAMKKASGAQNAGKNRRVRRMRPMSEAEFDAFCVGLKQLLVELDDAENEPQT